MDARFAALEWCVHERPVHATLRGVPLTRDQWAVAVDAQPIVSLPLGPSAAVAVDVPVPAATLGSLTLQEIVRAAAAFLQHHALSRAELDVVAQHEEAHGARAVAAAIRRLPCHSPPHALLPLGAKWRGVALDDTTGVARILIH